MDELREMPAVQVAAALADPLRFRLLRRLLDGPATVAELVAASGATQPNVSNHLALLRERRLVRTERRGRQVLYRVGGHAVAQLIETLAALDRTSSRPTAPSPLALARTCYDHLAGRLGVAVLEGLWSRRALERSRPGGVIDPGPAAEPVFHELGVDLARAAGSRRRFAFACLDWTEGQAHLGGALGAEVCSRAVGAGWVVRQDGTRAVVLSGSGRRALRRALGISSRG